jgi:hypothetical protein
LEPFLVSDLFIRIRETLHRSIQYGVGVKPCLESEISLTIYFTLLSETDKVGPEVLASIRETVAQALAGRGLLESGADEATRESTREVEGD